MRWVLACSLCGLVLWAPASLAARRYMRAQWRPGDEVALTNDEYKKLDRLEAHALDKADAIFREGKFRQAGAEYETFLREYPRSIALPYVLLRKARCLHLDDKRHEAARQYDEVVDYFPNAVEYAAAALFYQGQAHWDDGDEALALKSWARMAKDKQYRTHRLAAGAINKLADQLASQGQMATAVGYFHQVAVDFRATNRNAAWHARDRVIHYYVRTSPNEAKCRKFFAEARLLHNGKQTSQADLVKNPDYWEELLRTVEALGQFKPEQLELRKPYYTYWSGALDGKFEDRDEYQIGLARIQRAATGDAAGWVSRLDAQFAGGKTDDYSRVIRWIAEYGPVKAKVAEYYKKLNFGKMTPAQVDRLVRVLFDRVGDAKLAANALGQLNLSKMTDNAKSSLARYLWDRQFDWAKRLCESMTDAERGRNELLGYYHWRHDAKNGIPLADSLLKSDKYATGAMWQKGELLEWSKKYAEAIQVYRQCSNEPDNFWRIAGCQEKMGKVELAVKQLREIESFFKDYQAAACLRIAQVYNRAKLKDQCVAAFRRVLVKYPKSSESSTAHDELERMGITRIRGGVGEGKSD